MEKRLFIIKNNTHYLNVKNYLSNKGKGENYVILTIGSFQGDDEFVEEIQKNATLKVLEVIYTKSDVQLLNYLLVIKNIVKLKKLARSFKFFDEIIFSNYRNWIHHFILNQFKTNRKVLLSDGAGILIMAEYRKEPNKIPFESIPFNGSKFFVDKVLGIKPIKHLHFYSQIKMEIPPYDSIEVFKFNSSNSTNVRKEKVYFIGSPLIELGHLALEKQLEYLEVIREKYASSEIIYFAHRRERQENLDKYFFFGKVIRSDIPFEERMEKENELPGVILSYLSSVIINLPPVYPDINFYYFPLEDNDFSKNTGYLENYLIMRKAFEKIRESNFNKFPVREHMINDK